MKGKLLVALFIAPILMQACKSRPADIIPKDPNDTPTHIFIGNYLLSDSLTFNDSDGTSGEFPINRVTQVTLDSNFNRLVYQSDTYYVKKGTLNVFEQYNVSGYDYTTLTVTMDSLNIYGIAHMDSTDRRDYVKGVKLP